MSQYISAEVRAQIKALDDPLCAYCKTSVVNSGHPLTFDHIIPQAQGGSSDIENLCRACRQCNEFKGELTHGVDPQTGVSVSLFHPRQQKWSDHFEWDLDKIHLKGLTAIGRATIVSLNMNNDVILTARRRWVGGGWHPPASGR